MTHALCCNVISLIAWVKYNIYHVCSLSNRMVFPQFCCNPICDEVKTIGEELIRPSGLTNRDPCTLNSHSLSSGEVTEWTQSPPVNLFCIEMKDNHEFGVQFTCTCNIGEGIYVRMASQRL